MTVSRIFDNGYGDKYEVTCRFTDSFDSPHWRIDVSKKPKGKRKFISIVNEDSWEYRNAKNRDNYRYLEYNKEIPWSWVDTVMDEVVSKIRKLGNSIYPKE